jgi:hypothetical protein
MKVLTLAVNSITLSDNHDVTPGNGEKNNKIDEIIEFSKKFLKIEKIVATEILRCHSQRPGLLATDYNYQKRHLNASSTTSIVEVETCLLEKKLDDIFDATEDFKMVELLYTSLFYLLLVLFLYGFKLNFLYFCTKN